MPPDVLTRKLVPILYEDEYLLAVAKPSGVDAGGRTDQSAPGLAEILAGVRGGSETLDPINRLSRYESGVLLFGKTPDVVATLRGRLRSTGVEQEYVAVVLGKMREPRMKIGSGPPDSAGEKRQRGRRENRPPQHAAAERATVLTLVKAGERRTLVRCRTYVRSTHNLRAQLRSVRLRLMGDSLHDQSPRPKHAEETCLHLTRMTFEHPHSATRITLKCQPPGAFDGIVQGKREIERALAAALTCRLSCVTEADTDSYRLLTGDVEGVKGLVAEKYGRIVVLQVQEGSPHRGDDVVQVARWYREMLGVQAVYAKQQPVVGMPVPEQIAVTERGLKFAIRPQEGQSVGLFLDHRDNRKRVRSMAEGKDVLNLFAYTCGFSVAAAAGGANLTVSVDISPKSLKWGEANFELNYLDTSKHQFVQSEAFDYLTRAERQGQHFDLIVLDPPSFAHGRKRGQSFSVARDLVELIAASLKVLRPGGVMMIATNFRRLSIAGLRERVKQAAGSRAFRMIDAPPLPVDFAMDPDHAKTIFVRFD